MSMLEAAVLQHTSAEAAPLSSKPVRKLRSYRLPGEGSTFGLSVLSVTALLVLWRAATIFRWVPLLFLPSPQAIGRTFIDAWHDDIQGDQPLAAHLGWSALRVFGAFALTTATAIPIGLVMGVSRTTHGLFDPPIEFYRPLPPLAYLPLVVIWLSIGEHAEIVVVYLACFAPIVMTTRAGVRSATLEQISAAYALDASFTQVVRHVILPVTLPEILTGLRITIGSGWTMLVAAEMMVAAMDVGQMVLSASNFLRTNPVVMGIVLIGAITWAFDLVMRAIETRVMSWKGRSQP